MISDQIALHSFQLPIFITSVEIVLLSSEPNPYELAFIYDMLVFYNFMTAKCKITQVLIEFF